MVCKQYPVSYADWIIFAIGFVSFLFSMLLLVKLPPYDDFLKKWKEVKNEDAEKTYKKSIEKVA